MHDDEHSFKLPQDPPCGPLSIVKLPFRNKGRGALCGRRGAQAKSCRNRNLEEACSEGWRRVERRRRVVPSEMDSRETGGTVGTNLRRTYRIFCRWLSSLYVIVSRSSGTRQATVFCFLFSVSPLLFPRPYICRQEPDAYVFRFPFSFLPALTRLADGRKGKTTADAV